MGSMGLNFHTTSMKQTTETATPQKSARVRVLKHRLRIGDFIHAEGAEVVISVEEYELRKKDGEVELIALV